MVDKIKVKLPDGREVEASSVGDAVKTGLESITVATPESRKDLKEKLKKTVEAELRKPGVTAESLAQVIENLVKEHAKPKKAEEEAKLKKETREMANVLLQVKAKAGVEEAVKTFNAGADRVGSSSFPLGAVIGGALGLGATLLTEFGNWSSFSGILKNLAMITAGIAAGGLIGGDFGTSLFTPAKPKVDEKATTR